MCILYKINEGTIRGHEQVAPDLPKTTRCCVPNRSVTERLTTISGVDLRTWTWPVPPSCSTRATAALRWRQRRQQPWLQRPSCSDQQVPDEWCYCVTYHCFVFYVFSFFFLLTPRWSVHMGRSGLSDIRLHLLWFPATFLLSRPFFRDMSVRYVPTHTLLFNPMSLVLPSLFVLLKVFIDMSCQLLSFLEYHWCMYIISITHSPSILFYFSHKAMCIH